LIQAVGCALVLAPSPLCAGAGESLFFSARGAVHLYQKTDPDDIERVVTELSDPEYFESIEYDRKGWDFPFGLRIGVYASPRLSIFAMFERQPYALDGPLPESGTPTPPSDSIRFESPANLWGAGFDIGGFGGYLTSLRIGAAAGVLNTTGNDEDIRSIVNFTHEGTGWFAEINLSKQIDFERELQILPFVAYRLARADDITLFDERAPIEEVEPFKVDYSGLSFGVEIRFTPFAPPPE
jgi:hypothetical protein